MFGGILNWNSNASVNIELDGGQKCAITRHCLHPRLATNRGLETRATLRRSFIHREIYVRVIYSICSFCAARQCKLD